LESLRSISVYELNKIAKDHQEEFLDGPWREKFLRLIAEHPDGMRWSLGWVSALNLNGPTIWIVDAHGYGKRFIVRADSPVPESLLLSCP